MGIDLKVVQVEQQHPKLGRQLVHDPQSRGFPTKVAIDKSTWKTKTLRIYDPRVNPDQCHGECTGCAKAMELNTAGNRASGVVLDMNNAHEIYHFATIFDPFEDEWPPVDTGSSGLAACKAAKQLGLAGEYRHVFGGADEVVQLIMLNRVVNVGTWWYERMLSPNAKGVIDPSGPRVGGHQYIARGYNVTTDQLTIRCWWGSYRDVRIKREHLNELIMDDGDAHIQDRIKSREQSA